MATENYGINWANDAIDDLESIYDYWSEQESPFFANKIVDEILDSQKRIAKMPESLPLVQQLLHLPQKFRYYNTKRGYKIIVEIGTTDVFILRIFHVRQNLNEIFKGWD